MTVCFSFNTRRGWLVLFLVLLSQGLAGCTSMVTKVLITPSIESMQQQDDLDLVCQGAPAYLLMVDSMIARSPENTQLLTIGAQSYVAYVTALQECGTSSARLATLNDKAMRYGKAVVGRFISPLEQQSAETFDARLARLTAGDVPQLYWGSLAWLSWIIQQKGAAAAMSDMVVVEKIFTRILQLDDHYQNSGAHLFFGAYNSARPVMIGGNPELGRKHFEEALQNTSRKFLMIQTTFAETYARQTLDKDLHDTLLKEVLDFPLASAPECALSNQIAKRKARRLLDENYFAE